jgi:hypothetical protein
LLVRLDALELDEPGAAFPFSARLARKNGWSSTYARRVVAEYKRFIWLACRAGHPVTPSEEVDEAWHLHLCYTRSYWDDLCAGILGQPLHHGPTKGGTAEEAKFHDWYERTLESYRRHFGAEPPADIWPPAAIRFRPPTLRKVDSSRCWIVPKRVVKSSVITASALAAPALLAGCAGLLGAADLSGLICLFVPMFCILLLVMAVRKSKRRGGSRHGCSGATGFGVGCGGSHHHHHDSDADSGSSGCGSSGGSSGCGGGGCGGGGD